MSRGFFSAATRGAKGKASGEGHKGRVERVERGERGESRKRAGSPAFLFALAATASLLGGCAIDPEVRRQIDSVVTAAQSEVEGCAFIADVYSQAYSVEQSVDGMRFEAAKRHADTLVVSDVNAVTRPDFMFGIGSMRRDAGFAVETVFYGRGRAYACGARNRDGTTALDRISDADSGKVKDAGRSAKQSAGRSSDASVTRPASGSENSDAVGKDGASRPAPAGALDG